MLKKMLVIYNPWSSRHAAVEAEVFAELRNLRGWMVGKYAVKPTSFEENVANIEKLVDDGDLVIAAGGDGTTAMMINGVMRSGKNVTVGVLGYGNFNDVAGMLGEGSFTELMDDYAAGRINEMYPLEVKVNEKIWRYAAGYFTMGLLAEATKLMETKKMRKRLDEGKRGDFGSLVAAVWWYLKNKRRVRLSAGKWNGAAMQKKTTDYLAVNSGTLARIMKSEAVWSDVKEFNSGMYRLGGFWRMVRFGLTSVFRKVPLSRTTGDVIEFDAPSTVEMQTEGECEKLENIWKIEVGKGRGVKVANRTSSLSACVAQKIE